jgi:hypothetical protein
MIFEGASFCSSCILCPELTSTFLNPSALRMLGSKCYTAPGLTLRELTVGCTVYRLLVPSYLFNLDIDSNPPPLRDTII